MLLGEPTCYSEVLQYAARDAARAGAEGEWHEAVVRGERRSVRKLAKRYMTTAYSVLG